MSSASPNAGEVVRRKSVAVVCRRSTPNLDASIRPRASAAATEEGRRKATSEGARTLSRVGGGKAACRERERNHPVLGDRL